METQNNAGNQNIQPTGQNPDNQPVQIPEKPRMNYWMVSTIVLLIIIVSGGLYIISLRNQLNIVNSSQKNQSASSNPMLSLLTSTPVPTARAVLTGQPQVEWTRKQFGAAWDIEYPKNWEVNEAGLVDGNISLKGEYDGISYSLALGYPIFTDFDPPGTPESLDVWVNKELSFIPQDKRAAVKVVSATVAGTTAKKVHNLPEKIFDDGKTRKYSENIIDEVYIWKRGDKNPVTVILRQNSGIINSEKAKAFLDIFLSKIR